MATWIKETFFISHGSPVLLLDHSLPARHFMLDFTERVYGLKPKAIVVISAHLATLEPMVNVINGCNDTIHDFTNFPCHMYEKFRCQASMIDSGKQFVNTHTRE